MIARGAVAREKAGSEPSSRDAQQAERCCGMVRLPLLRPVEQQARQRLLKDCPYAFFFRGVTLEFKDGVLTLQGRVPTFYLKQMLQVWLRNLDGVKRIDNQVDVVSATGLSSQPRTESLG